MEEGIPLEPPSWMSKDVLAVDFYTAIAEALNEIGSAKAFQQFNLGLLSEAWSHHRKLEEQILEDGEVLENPEKGTKYMNPARISQITRAKDIQRECENLGITVKQLSILAPMKPKIDKKDEKDAANYMTG